MAGLIRAAMIFHSPVADANEIVTTCHVNLTGGSVPDNSIVDDVAGKLEDWWSVGIGGGGALKANFSGTVKLIKVVAQALQPGPPALPREIASNVVGTSAEVAGAPQESIVLSLRTETAGRSYRGRMYLPPIPDSAVDAAGLIDSGWQQTIANSAEGMRDSMDGVDGGLGELAVYSRVLDVATRVTSIRVGNRIDIQRRRKIREVSYVTGV